MKKNSRSERHERRAGALIELCLLVRKTLIGHSPEFYRQNSSCSSALFSFTKAIKYCNNLGSKAYCAFLDAIKAFDKVLHNGLFLKLIKRINVPIGFIKLLRNWYSRLRRMGRLNGKLGTAFPILCGILQRGDIVTIFICYLCRWLDL